MRHETSPSTHRPYGIARVTRVWQVPRSTVYAQRNRRARPTPVAKRGPKPPQSDAELTAAVRAVIAASPFHGEGHRKIWARLRVQGLRTSKRRTLVVMRAADLLGPARLPTPVAARPHDGTIVTASPNVMWGTDATATVTLADGTSRSSGRSITARPNVWDYTRRSTARASRRWSRCARASEITSGRWPPAWRAGSRCATTTAVST